MNVTKQNTEMWLALYAAVEKFKELAPWEWMHDNDMFGVEDPVSGETGYCMVMGNLGEVFALGVYWGAEGLESYEDLIAAHEDEDSETDQIMAGLEQKMLKVEFVNREEMSSEDLAHLKALGLKFRGANQWVQLRDIRPGYHPWYIDEKQAEYLIHALEQAVNVTARFKNNRALLHPEHEKMLVRVRTETPTGFQWKDEYRDLPEPLEEDDPVINTFLLNRVKKELKPKPEALCLALTYLPGGVRDEKGGAPYFVMIAIYAMYGSGFIAGFDLYKPGQIETDFEEHFFNKLFTLGFLPEQIIVNSSRAAWLLDPYTDALGIELIYDEEEPVFEEVVGAMSRHMR